MGATLYINLRTREEGTETIEVVEEGGMKEARRRLRELAGTVTGETWISTRPVQSWLEQGRRMGWTYTRRGGWQATGCELWFGGEEGGPICRGSRVGRVRSASISTRLDGCYAVAVDVQREGGQPVTRYLIPGREGPMLEPLGHNVHTGYPVEALRWRKVEEAKEALEEWIRKVEADALPHRLF